jgi:hypothetical protein
MKKLFFALILCVSVSIKAQQCVSNSNWYEWNTHNNWFLGLWNPSDGASYILNQRTDELTQVKQPDFELFKKWTTSISAYEAVSAASDDEGNLVFFTNARKAWKADGTLITDEIKGGNECGAIGDKGASANGLITVRHPLDPDHYYLLTSDDIVNQGNVTPENQIGTCGNGITVTKIDKDGNLMYVSKPIDSIIGEGRGMYRITESMTATIHGNGIDVWVTVHPLYATYYLSYLLTVDGFVTPPVKSEGVAPYVNIDEGRGDLAYSSDGSMFASAVYIDFEAQSDTLYEYAGINLYDFNNWTGELSNRKDIYPDQWGSIPCISLNFTADDSELHYSGLWSSGKLSVDGTTEEIRASHTASEYLSGGFYSAELSYQGELVSRDSLNLRYNEIGQGNHYGMNNIYIPPSDKPVIMGLDTLCSTDESVDLSTTWLCSGSDVESCSYIDSTDNGYFGVGIINRNTGTFHPSLAGVGTHQIVFTMEELKDTTWVTVKSCGVVSTESISLKATVFPNPADGTINIQRSNVSSFDYEILSVMGSVLIKGGTRLNQVHVDISELPSGTYFVKVMGGEEVFEIVPIFKK